MVEFMRHAELMTKLSLLQFSWVTLYVLSQKNHKHERSCIEIDGISEGLLESHIWSGVFVFDRVPPCGDIRNRYLHQNRFNTLRPSQDGRHFAADIFKCIFLNKYVRISAEISLKFVPKGTINNIPSLVQIMAWRQPGDKPLSEPMIVRLSTHICVTRPQWVKHRHANQSTSRVSALHM